VTHAIAIFEDEGITALHLSTLLTSSGYSVVAVADEADSVEALIESTKPDLVLMDIHLKGGMDL
jgi:CheY-like chemotaxis protein